MPVMLVQLGRTAPTFVQGPRREVEVKMGMWSPVANTKYFLLAELYRIAGSRRTMLPARWMDVKKLVRRRWGVERVCTYCYREAGSESRTREPRAMRETKE